MNINEMSIQDIISSIIMFLLITGTYGAIIWWALDPCAFEGHEKPKIRMLKPTCWRCGKELKEDK